MAMLHTVNKSPFERNTLDSCMKHALPGSAILLIEDGVVAATRGTAVEGKVKEKMGDVSFFVLGPDLAARGLGEDKLIDGISVVDYNGFVELTTKYDNVQSWL